MRYNTIRIICDWLLNNWRYVFILEKRYFISWLLTLKIIHSYQNIKELQGISVTEDCQIAMDAFLMKRFNSCWVMSSYRNTWVSRIGCNRNCRWACSRWLGMGHHNCSYLSCCSRKWKYGTLFACNKGRSRNCCSLAFCRILRRHRRHHHRSYLSCGRCKR